MDQADLERLKHELVSKLEEQKWGYKKEEVQFLEAGNHLRSLNQIMWQVPSMAIAVTGGLWYGVTVIDTALPKMLVLAFAAVFDGVTMIVVGRLRNIIEMQIGIQRSFSGTPLLPMKERDRLVVRCWCFILGTAAVMSILGALNVDQFKRAPKEETGRSFQLEDEVRSSSVASKPPAHGSPAARADGK